MNIVIDVAVQKQFGYFNQSGGLPQLHVICIYIIVYT